MSGQTPDVGAGFPGEDLPGEYRFSMFRSLTDTSPQTVTLADLRMFIGEGLCAELVDRIRAEPDKARRSELKRGLPCVTISGEFAGGHKAEFDAWRWARLEETPELIIPFKRNVYREVVRQFAPFAGAAGAKG